jgi:glycosyltransferase involved in cell wall biosynthesis
VILTVYDRLTFIADALKSIERQTFGNYEVIVADDSGTGAARTVSVAAGDPRIRHSANTPSVGVALSVRAGLLKARGKYIAVLNDDDLWEPEFLERMLAPLEADGSRVLAFCDHFIVGADGVIDAAATRRNTQRFGRAHLAEGDIADPKAFVVRQNGVPLAMGAVLRASALDPHDLVDEVAGAYDFWISSRLAACGGSFYYVPARLTRYRVHPGMETVRRDPEKTNCLAFIARSLLAEPGFARHRDFLERWLASLSVRSGRDYLYFNRVDDARCSFISAYQLSAGWKPVAGYLVSLAPERLRRAAGITRA